MPPTEAYPLCYYLVQALVRNRGFRSDAALQWPLEHLHLFMGRFQLLPWTKELSENVAAWSVCSVKCMHIPQEKMRRNSEQAASIDEGEYVYFRNQVMLEAGTKPALSGKMTCMFQSGLFII